jgi:D-tyrosyl-tRNA(Tyr) deacylase
MKALLQRVSQASVNIEGRTVSSIGPGLLVLLGIDRDDDQIKADQLLHKVLHYRIFADTNGKMNLNVLQAVGALLVVPQFTLSAQTGKGLRPRFSSAASRELGQDIYQYFVNQAKRHIDVSCGRFGANMQVNLTNEGPVTFLLKV